jgi:hypothetical protein
VRRRCTFFAGCVEVEGFGQVVHGGWVVVVDGKLARVAAEMDDQLILLQVCFSVQ